MTVFLLFNFKLKEDYKYVIVKLLAIKVISSAIYSWSMYLNANAVLYYTKQAKQNQELDISNCWIFSEHEKPHFESHIQLQTISSIWDKIPNLFPF